MDDHILQGACLEEGVDVQDAQVPCGVEWQVLWNCEFTTVEQSEMTHGEDSPHDSVKEGVERVDRQGLQVKLLSSQMAYLAL